MKSTLGKVHIVFGIAGVLGFVVTGQFMKYNFPEIYSGNEAMRMMYRANHMYILMAGLINGVLGIYFSFNPIKLLARIQVFASMFLLISLVLYTLAFAVEPASMLVERNITFWATVSILVGCGFHLFTAIGHRLFRL